MAVPISANGTHQWNLSQDAVKEIFMLTNYSDMMFCISIGFVKVSILLLTTRIFLVVKRSVFFWFAQFLIFANAVYYAIALFINIFACRPRRAIWDPAVPGKCPLDRAMLYISSASFNTVSDVTMLLIPMVVIWRLQMSARRKLGVSLVFGTGGFATLCAIVRIYFQMKNLHTHDNTFVHVQTSLLAYAEVACGIGCCCLPLLPLLWHQVSSTAGSKGISMGPMHKSAQTNCGVHESYNPDNSVGPLGGNWVRLEDGTVTDLPKLHGVVRSPSDEEALRGAIAGTRTK